MTAHQVILHLSLCDTIGPVTIQRLLALGLSDLCELYSWTARDWMHRAGMSESKASLLVSHLQSFVSLEQELAALTHGSANYVTYADTDYPLSLRAIYAPPPILYYRGSLETLKNSHAVAIIGSRAANNYGMRFIKECVPVLVKADFVIVSGGALGADSMAHKEALRAQGTTVAVLGSGLLNLYPRTNSRLFEDIIAQGGTVVTPFAMRSEAMPGNFPARNRIIAGLARGCLVVQAAEKSGTRITANFALQQGREVFVVPGHFDDPLSAGCHALAREGATLVTSADDICNELGVLPSLEQKTMDLNVSVSEQIKENPAQKDQSPAARIQAAISHTALSAEEIALQLALEHEVVQQQLWDLQWQGIVQQDFTGRWHS